ncbi:hypothetical protein RQP53_15570 [Paucibacter sp. APW11]|uniref:Uncharacterized protein n=1 Tax=Roseateles aquae TaxID=3077235 RepID=A0ABU3PDM5_9BURK|nr:hypothetical protein [Paucibacter sp. APW11]MDT9000694.1 hypothetical protein [Paucibacter sp. APW11]
MKNLEAKSSREDRNTQEASNRGVETEANQERAEEAGLRLLEIKTLKKQSCAYLCTEYNTDL